MNIPCGLIEIFVEDILIDVLHKENFLDLNRLIDEHGVCTLENFRDHINQYVLIRGILDQKKTALTKINGDSELVKI